MAVVQSVLFAAYGPRAWSYVLSSRANQIGAYQKSEAMEAHREVQAPQPAAPHLILARQGHLGPSGLFLPLYYIILERVDHPRTVPCKHIITSQFWRYYQHEQGKAKGTEFVKSKRTAVDQKGSLASLVLLLLECGGSPAHF